ncbi:MAG: winged helix-turn-helix domain-containing protein [Candidatus Micrarchaeota archaeon]
MDSIQDVLSSKTRKEILERLSKRNYRPSDLSRELGKNTSTIVEHLEKLNTAGLVERLEREGYKWVFYKLSKNGQAYFSNAAKRTLFFAISLISFIGIIISLFMTIQTSKFEDNYMAASLEKSSIPVDGLEKTGVPLSAAIISGQNNSNISENAISNTSQRIVSCDIQLDRDMVTKSTSSQQNIYFYTTIAMLIIFAIALICAQLTKTNSIVIPKNKLK